MTYELPEPSFKLTWKFGGYYVSEPEIGNTDCYTAEQMRASYDKGLEDAAAELKLEADYSGSNRRAILTFASNLVRSMKGAP